MVEVVLDSDVIIDWLRDERRASRLQNLVSQPTKYSFYITSVSQFELLVGGYATNTASKIIDQLTSFDILNFDYKAADIAAKFYASLRKKGETPPLKDLFIASICLSFDLPLVTRNKKDFVRFKGLDIMDLEKI